MASLDVIHIIILVFQVFLWIVDAFFLFFWVADTNERKPLRYDRFVFLGVAVATGVAVAAWSQMQWKL